MLELFSSYSVAQDCHSPSSERFSYLGRSAADAAEFQDQRGRHFLLKAAPLHSITGCFSVHQPCVTSLVKHPLSNCSKWESAGITHFPGQAESFFLMETYLAAQQIEPKLQKYIDGSFVQLARPHYTPTSLLPSLSITVSSQGSSAPAAASHCKKIKTEAASVLHTECIFLLTYERNGFLLRTKQTRVAN